MRSSDSPKIIFQIRLEWFLLLDGCFAIGGKPYGFSNSLRGIWIRHTTGLRQMRCCFYNLWRWSKGNLHSCRSQVYAVRRQDLGCKTICFPEHSEEEVLGTDVPVMEAFCLLCRIRQDTLALIRERKI